MCHFGKLSAVLVRVEQVQEAGQIMYILKHDCPLTSNDQNVPASQRR